MTVVHLFPEQHPEPSVKTISRNELAIHLLEQFGRASLVANDREREKQLETAVANMMMFFYELKSEKQTG